MTPMNSFKSVHALNYLLDIQRRQYIESVSQEYLSILAILYGDRIETGMSQVKDFGSMTMLEAENELRIRTMMTHGRRVQKQRQLREEHTRNETDMLEELKRLA